MLHGLAGHAGEWDATARRLRSRYRVVAVDQRGHGSSERHPQDVSRVADVMACHGSPGAAAARSGGPAAGRAHGHAHRRRAPRTCPRARARRGRLWRPQHQGAPGCRRLAAEAAQRSFLPEWRQATCPNLGDPGPHQLHPGAGSRRNAPATTRHPGHE
ncbi:alpha/beta fold hydrolase [Streptomyces sp. NPDC126514]|uniref:alpha/beta fold hydrolase n=1 Tax=Streptomyces sp. NPDC126514 TaxID=3155210 RepID=UPI00332921DB